MNIIALSPDPQLLAGFLRRWEGRLGMLDATTGA